MRRTRRTAKRFGSDEQPLVKEGDDGTAVDEGAEAEPSADAEADHEQEANDAEDVIEKVGREEEEEGEADAEQENEKDEVRISKILSNFSKKVFFRTSRKKTKKAAMRKVRKSQRLPDSTAFVDVSLWFISIKEKFARDVLATSIPADVPVEERTDITEIGKAVLIAGAATLTLIVMTWCCLVQTNANRDRTCTTEENVSEAVSCRST